MIVLAYELFSSNDQKLHRGPKNLMDSLSTIIQQSHNTFDGHQLNYVPWNKILKMIIWDHDVDWDTKLNFDIFIY